jgi:hypothetical protein
VVPQLLLAQDSPQNPLKTGTRVAVAVAAAATGALAVRLAQDTNFGTD